MPASSSRAIDLDPLRQLISPYMPPAQINPGDLVKAHPAEGDRWLRIQATFPSPGAPERLPVVGWITDSSGIALNNPDGGRDVWNLVLTHDTVRDALLMPRPGDRVSDRRDGQPGTVVRMFHDFRDAPIEIQLVEVQLDGADETALYKVWELERQPYVPPQRSERHLHRYLRREAEPARYGRLDVDRALTAAGLAGEQIVVEHRDVRVGDLIVASAANYRDHLALTYTTPEIVVEPLGWVPERPMALFDDASGQVLIVPARVVAQLHDEHGSLPGAGATQ